MDKVHFIFGVITLEQTAAVLSECLGSTYRIILRHYFIASRPDDLECSPTEEAVMEPYRTEHFS